MKNVFSESSLTFKNSDLYEATLVAIRGVFRTQSNIDVRLGCEYACGNVLYRVDFHFKISAKRKKNLNFFL